MTSVPLSDAKPGDKFRCCGLSGTLVKLVQHSNGSYSVWLEKPTCPWIENFEWILWEEPYIERV